MKKLLTNKPKADGSPVSLRGFPGCLPSFDLLLKSITKQYAVMKITAILEIPEDFRLHCEIYSCNAQDVLQEFVNQVSLPRHRTANGRRHELATGFFMDYLDHLPPEEDRPDDIHEFYLDKIAYTVAPIQNEEQRESVCRKIMRQWALAVRNSSLTKI